MMEKIFETASGMIHYWMNDVVPNRKTLVFLPGLTAYMGCAGACGLAALPTGFFTDGQGNMVT